MGLTPKKTISVGNLKPKAIDEYRQRLLEKNLKTCEDEKFFVVDLKLTLTIRLSLTLGLGLGLTPGKKKSVENLKPNAKY